MVVIERVETGGLRVSNARQSAVVDDEQQARSTLHSWGHTDLSINMALAEMRRREGGADAEPRAWRITRPAQAPPEPTAGEADAQTHDPKTTMAASPRKRRSRRAESGADAADPDVVPESAEAPATPAKRTRTRKRASPRETEAVPEAPVTAADTKPGRKPRRRKAAEPAPDPNSDPVPVEVAAPDSAAEREVAPRKKRQRRTKAGSPPEPVAAPLQVDDPAPDAVAEEAPRRRASRARAAKAKNTPEPTAAADGAVEEVPTDRVAAARFWFEKGTEMLREIERETLPFARGPWTDLRERGESVVAALEGREPTA